MAKTGCRCPREPNVLSTVSASERPVARRLQNKPAARVGPDARDVGPPRRDSTSLNRCEMGAGMIHVLVVDDEDTSRRAITTTLQRAGMHVTAVADGESALALPADQPFDAALIDLLMPRMNGLELTRRLHAVRPELRVVLTSSFPLSLRQIERTGLEGVRFFPKDGPVEDLLTLLRHGPVPQVSVNSDVRCMLAPSHDGTSLALPTPPVR